MERRRRTEILVEADPSLAARLAAAVRRGRKVAMIEEAGECLVMLKVRETAKRGLFFMGEVLATQAKAMVEGQIGLGIVRGRKAELASDLAVIDAAYNARLPEAEAWEAELAAAEAEIAARRLAEGARTARTLVDFRTMDLPEGK